MKKNFEIGWLIFGLCPYAFLLGYSIYSAIHGISGCLMDEYQGCSYYYGLRGFAEAWYKSLYILFPVFLVFLFFIILGLSKTKFTSITRSRLFLTFGLAPFLLALFLLLFASMANPGSSFAGLFSSIFMRHFFVAISEIIGIIFILFGLKGLKKSEKNKKDI